MYGPDANDPHFAEQKGIIPRAVEHIFDALQEERQKVSARVYFYMKNWLFFHFFRIFVLNFKSPARLLSFTTSRCAIFSMLRLSREYSQQ